MYQKDTMDSIVSALGGEPALARLVQSYRMAVEDTTPHLLEDRFDDFKLVDSRSYLIRDCVQHAFCDQMKLNGFDTRISTCGGSWWQNCVATGNGLAVTTCKISSAGSKLPENQFVNRLKHSNQMVLPFISEDDDTDGDEPIKVVLAYYTVRLGGKTLFSGLEIVIPAANASDEMRMDITRFGDSVLTQPAHVDGPVVRVKQRRRVGNGDA